MKRAKISFALIIPVFNFIFIVKFLFAKFYISKYFEGDYLSDYVYTATSLIPLDFGQIREDVSIELCSMLCTTSDGFYCKAFYYCGESKKCILLNDQDNITGNMTIKSVTGVNVNVNRFTQESCANYKSKKPNHIFFN
jgi:hypothetical protein